MTTSSSVVTEAGGRQNVYAAEPHTYIDPDYKSYAHESELANARWAMIGFVAAVGAYATTGQFIPGVF
ncbi:chlorophyll a/b-binding protein [Prochlorococcus sp. MIT 1307]|uniref:chlorophyll a/b-binding protein n=1 Tax=Prochlorococcus sp. MIT 1307 TaxID=3096219 RepID=UPI002A748670|nr:chlorophyll a/b-binding protein [Prochlorococcus sp. MIT 1307]